MPRQQQRAPSIIPEQWANVLRQTPPVTLGACTPVFFFYQPFFPLNHVRVGSPLPHSAQSVQPDSLAPKKIETCERQPTPKVESKSPTTDEENSSNENTSHSKKADPEHQIAQRKKQINFGYVTEGYRRCRASNPPSTDEANPDRPTTPDVHESMAKRKFDAKISQWRRSLHRFNNTPYPEDYDIHPEWSITEAKIIDAQLSIFNRYLDVLFKEIDFDTLPLEEQRELTAVRPSVVSPSLIRFFSQRDELEREEPSPSFNPSI